MVTEDLQNYIIQNVLHTYDYQLLDFFNQILDNNDSQKIYQLSDFKKSIVSECMADYEAGKRNLQ